MLEVMLFADLIVDVLLNLYIDLLLFLDFTYFFFIVSIFTKFGMVQETVNQVTERVLSTFPDEHRAMFTEYVVKFRDG